MENIKKDNLYEHGFAKREVWNPEYLKWQTDFCNKFTGVEQVECWRSLGPLVLAVINRDLEETVSICQNAPGQASQRACMRETLGQELVNKIAGGEQSLSEG